MFNYNKVNFIDNETPLNASTMNHIDTAISRLATNSLFPSDIIAGEGIDISSYSGKIKISQSQDSLVSVSVSRLEVVTVMPENPDASGLYLLVDVITKALKSLWLGNICLFTVGNSNDGENKIEE